MTIVLGWDWALGFFACVTRPNRPRLTYDSTTTADGTTSIAGVLHTLIDSGVITRGDVVEAEQWLASGDVENIPAEQVGVRVAAEVILHLRDAAGR